MFPTPKIPNIPGLPLMLELSQMGLAIVLALVCIFFAVASVVLVYHWRRFPYERQTLHRVERWYEIVSMLLLGIAVFGVFFS